MAEAVEVNEVRVTGHLIATREFDRVKSAVCLLKPGDSGPGSIPGKNWKASGFYVKLTLHSKKKRKKGKTSDVHCIMTNFHVLQMKQENESSMVAVFNHEGGGDQKSFEVPLVPFKLFASEKDLDYALIRVDENKMSSLGIQPISADPQNLPKIMENETVYIIQHPGGSEKHFSTDQIKRIDPPFVEYFADTLGGSSGSPVFVVVKSVYVLIALHCKGVEVLPLNYNKGVLISEILSHLETGKSTKPRSILSPGVPGQVESGCHVAQKGRKDPLLPVARDDIANIALDITNVWRQLGRALQLSDSSLDIIDADKKTAYDKNYEMLTKWKQTKVSKANYGTLAAALLHPSVDRGDLIEKYC